MTDIQEIQNDLREVLGPKIQCDLERMFPQRKGLLARARVKRKLKLLKNLAPGLATVLVDGEKLIYAARGYIVRNLQSIYALGLIGQITNITCAVLTDRRILLINTNFTGKGTNYRNQLLYTEITAVNVDSSICPSSVLNLKDGKTLTMAGIKAVDRKYMQHYILQLVSSMPDDVPRLGGSIQYLCPRCPAIYLELQTECKNCGTTFKSAQKAALMSLLLPGLGDIYLGHTPLGVIELLGSLAEWAILVRITAALASGREGAVRFLLGWIVFMAVTNVIAYFATRAKGRRGLIAEKGSTKDTFGASIAGLQSSNAD